MALSVLSIHLNNDNIFKCSQFVKNFRFIVKITSSENAQRNSLTFMNNMSVQMLYNLMKITITIKQYIYMAFILFIVIIPRKIFAFTIT